MVKARRYSAGLVLAAMQVAFLAGIPAASAAEDPTFRIEFNDGEMSPREIEVPAGVRIKLELHNLGETPAEFESLELKKEKVLAPKSSSSLIIRTLAPGRYEFFDDFHPGKPPAVLIAK